jgi:hypothetical protein
VNQQPAQAFESVMKIGFGRVFAAVGDLGHFAE